MKRSVGSVVVVGLIVLVGRCAEEQRANDACRQQAAIQNNLPDAQRTAVCR